MKYLLYLSLLFLICCTFSCCQFRTKETIQEQRKAYELKKCNDLLPGVYDSLALIYHDSFLGYSTPINIFHRPPTRLDLTRESRKPIYLFHKIYQEKEIHKLLLKKHTIRVLAFEEKKRPFSSYEMDYEIPIIIDSDTFHYRYITPTNFKKIESHGGIDYEPRFFWTLYKDEPLVCEYILKKMEEEGFVTDPYMKNTFWFWSLQTAEKHNSLLAKELFCKSIFNYQYYGGVLDEQTIQKAKDYNCKSLVLILKKHKLRQQKK